MRVALFVGALLVPLVAEGKKGNREPATPQTPVVVPTKVFPPAPAPEDSTVIAAEAAKIDALVVAGLTKAGQKLNAPASDEELVRRLYLDVAGRIPTATEATTFLADTDPAKRAKLIDRLVGSDGYNSHMFNWLADMLRVEDDLGKGTKTFVYEEWLKDQIAQNRTWDALVYDMLTAHGRLSNNGPVGYLLRDRGMPLDNLSNTLTIFLGANVACAQCHDHPLAQWKQRDFYEMASFFGATDAGFKKKGKVQGVNTNALAESSGLGKRAILEVVYPNAADVETLHRNTLNFPKDYKYDDAKPGDPVKPTLMSWSTTDAKNPSYAIDSSTPEMLREQFATWMTHPQNPRFATAIANRLWKRVFGLAVQEPITDLDNLEKASNPQLLEQLTVEMKRVKFDLREFQRIVLNTQAYQSRASSTPDLAKGPYLFPGPLLRRMTAEQAWDSVLTLVVGPELDQFKLRRADEVRRVDIEGPITGESVVAKAKEIAAADAAKGKRKHGGKKNGAGVEVTSDEFGSDPPPTFEGLVLARASELAQPSREAHFLRMFGQSDRQVADDGNVEGGVPQVLMLMNGDVQKVIASRASLVLKDAAKQQTSEAQVKSLYISFLGRAPTAQESRIACQAMGDKLSLADLTWVLFNSREFIFIQ
jgi:hypothetical protein